MSKIQGLSPIARLLLLLLLVSGILALILLLIFAGYTYWFFKIYPNLPVNPIAQGEFPSQPVWVFEADETVVATPTISGSQAFIRTRESIYSLDITNGQQIWRADSPSESRRGETTISPEVSGDYLVVPERGSGLAAFSTKTGELLWRIPALDINSELASVAAIDSIAMDSDFAYVARSKWKLTSYCLKNGAIIWEQKIPAWSSDFIETDSQVVYLGGNHFLTAYDVKTGTNLWQKDYSQLVSTGLLKNNILYTSLLFGDRSLEALDIETLKDVWQINAKSINEDEIGSIISGDNFITAAGTHLIKVNERDGSVLWISDKFGLLERPVILGDRIYARNSRNDLYSIDVATGKEMGRLIIQPNSVMKGDADRSPGVAGDLLIVPFGDNRVYAYRP